MLGILTFSIELNLKNIDAIPSLSSGKSPFLGNIPKRNILKGHTLELINFILKAVSL